GRRPLLSEEDQRAEEAARSTLLALLATSTALRAHVPRVMHGVLRASYDGWRDERSRKQLLEVGSRDPGEAKWVEGRWAFMLRLLAMLEGQGGPEKQTAKGSPQARRRRRGKRLSAGASGSYKGAAHSPRSSDASFEIPLVFGGPLRQEGSSAC
ncbi:MAG: hypothetical protein INR71_04785, partial [Terriglobus roseus]|nr:hypothetical protein [Terriglobus roseus]